MHKPEKIDKGFPREEAGPDETVVRAPLARPCTARLLQTPVGEREDVWRNGDVREEPLGPSHAPKACTRPSVVLGGRPRIPCSGASVVNARSRRLQKGSCRYRYKVRSPPQESKVGCRTYYSEVRYYFRPHIRRKSNLNYDGSEKF